MRGVDGTRSNDRNSWISVTNNNATTTTLAISTRNDNNTKNVIGNDKLYRVKLPLVIQCYELHTYTSLSRYADSSRSDSSYVSGYILNTIFGALQSTRSITSNAWCYMHKQCRHIPRGCEINRGITERDRYTSAHAHARAHTHTYMYM